MRKASGRAAIDLERTFFQVLPPLGASAKDVQEWLAIWLFVHDVPHSGFCQSFDITLYNLSGDDINRSPLDQISDALRHCPGVHGLELGCTVILMKDIHRARKLTANNVQKEVAKLGVKNLNAFEVWPLPYVVPTATATPDLTADLLDTSSSWETGMTAVERPYGLHTPVATHGLSASDGSGSNPSWEKSVEDVVVGGHTPKRPRIQ